MRWEAGGNEKKVGVQFDGSREELSKSRRKTGWVEDSITTTAKRVAGFTRAIRVLDYS